MAKEKIELIEDFSGGLNTRLAPNRIDPKQSPTCLNVWNDTGALIKRKGFTSAAISYSGISFDLSRSPFVWDDATTAALDTYAIFTSRESVSAICQFIYSAPTSTTFTTSTTFLPFSYATGTVAVTNGSATLTGTGTSWNSLSAVASSFHVVIAGVLYPCTSVDSDTSITLASVWAGSTDSGLSYRVCPTASVNGASYCSMNTFVYATPSAGSTVKWSPSSSPLTWKHISAFPKATGGVGVLKNYVFAANYGSTTSRVAWSALKDPETWPASNFIDVNPDDGDVIIGIVNVGPGLLIFKQKSAHLLTGDVFDPANPTYTLTKVFTPIEAQFANMRTFQLFGNQYLFFGKSGIYKYDGTSVISRVSQFDIIQSEWDAIAGGAINGGGSAITYRGNYWIGLRTTSVYPPNEMFAIDARNAIWKWTTASLGTGGQGQLGDMFVANGSAYSLSQGDFLILDTTDNDSGTAINGTWTSKVFQFDGKQRFGLAYVYYKKQAAGNLTFEYSIDEGAFSSVTISMTTGDGTRVKSAPIVVGTVGSSIQFRISNSTASQTFEVYAIQFGRITLRT